jgi:CheY-like chemotaxis protein
VETSSNLTKQLLTFSRKNQLMLETLDVHELIAEAIDILSRSIDKRIALDIDLNSEYHFISADKTLMQNAILNMCLNARDAMPNGGVLTVSTEYVNELSDNASSERLKHQTGPFIQISFKDTGIGIPEYEHSKIFEPFFTTKETGSGTGLGLAAVYSTIMQLGGDITLDSKVGIGSCFTILLQLSKDINAESRTTTNSTLTDNKTTQSQTILVAEDEPMLRELCASCLKTAGHKAIFATNGLDAVTIFNQRWRDIDLVILDIMMPEMNGRDALARLKAINPDVKVIVTSGYSADSTTEELLCEGVSIVLNKPFKHAELIDAIDKVSAK